MALVRTVLGDIDAAELGITYAHEHVLISGGMPVILDKDFLLNDGDRAVQDLSSFHALGGRTVVDMMPSGLGRDPDGLRLVSERCGVHIIAATGFHSEKFYDTQHWLYHYTVEEIGELFRAEIEDGMDQGGYRGPQVRRSPARAGVIKVATGYFTWNQHTDRWFTAAALAHGMSGAPIISHTDNGVLGDRQAQKLIDEGVSPTAIIIGHMDKNVDPYIHRELAAMGVFLQYDSPSRQKYGPDSDAVSLIAAAAKHGYANRILLGMDLARRSYYRSYGGGPGLEYLLETFWPRLRAEGLGDVAEQIFRHNPARAFALADRSVA